MLTASSGIPAEAFFLYFTSTNTVYLPETTPEISVPDHKSLVCQISYGFVFLFCPKRSLIHLLKFTAYLFHVIDKYKDFRYNLIKLGRDVLSDIKL